VFIFPVQVIQVQFFKCELKAQEKAEKQPAKEDVALLINPASTKDEPLPDEDLVDHSELLILLN